MIAEKDVCEVYDESLTVTRRSWCCPGDYTRDSDRLRRATAPRRWRDVSAPAAFFFVTVSPPWSGMSQYAPQWLIQPDLLLNKLRTGSVRNTLNCLLQLMSFSLWQLRQMGRWTMFSFWPGQNISERSGDPLDGHFLATVSIGPLSCPVCDVGVLWPNGWMHLDETWHAGRPRPRPHC